MNVYILNISIYFIFGTKKNEPGEDTTLFYSKDERISFNVNIKRFYFLSAPGQKKIIFRGLSPLLRELFWSNYDYAEATKSMTIHIKTARNHILENSKTNNLPYHGKNGKDLGILIHEQVDHVIKNLSDFTPQKMLDNEFLHPVVKHIFVALGKANISPIASEESVFNTEIKLATKIDLIGRRRICIGDRVHYNLVLMELKTGYPGGAFSCSNGSMQPNAVFQGLLTNSPLNQAQLQLLFSYKLLEKRLKNKEDCVELLIIHAVGTRVDFIKIDPGMKRTADFLYQYAVSRAAEDSFIGRPLARKRSILNKKKP